MKKLLLTGIVSMFLAGASYAQTAEMLNFDGTNDFVSCGNVLPASYTKELWVKFTSITGVNKNLISGGNATGQHAFLLNTGSGLVGSGHNGAYTAVQDPSPVVINTWYHYTVTYDAPSTTMKLYRNGVLVSTNTAVPVYTSGNQVNLGWFNGGTGYHSGNMDEVRVWNYALTAAEINSSMNCELTGTEPGLILYYNFNQGIAGGNNAGLTTLNDLAAPANNGTLTNFTLNGATSNWISPSIITTGTSCSCPTVSVSLSSQTNISCNGGSNGSATVSASGGTTFTYSWAPSGGTAATSTGLTAGTYTCTVTNECSNTGTIAVTITQPSALVVSPVSQTNISCNGGSNGAASVSVAGGTTSYSYNWTPGNPTGDGTASVTGLTATTWTCTVTDANSCVSTATFNITAPSAISVTAASQTNVSCFGGSNGAASINTPTGGAGGYTYNWTPGNPTGDGTVAVSGLTAGSWTCTVTDANGCTATQTFNVTSPSAISVTAASQTNVSCFGGSNGAASINTPTGGAGGYTYNWTPGNPTGDGTVSVTGLTATSWTCTVTDANGCTATQTFNVTSPSAISVTPASQTNVSCFGGSNGAASVNTPTGGAGGYTYNWTPGNPTGDGTVSVTGLTATTWTCTVTDANSCTSTATFNLTSPSAISLTSAQTNVTCNAACNGSATVTPTGGVAPYTYSWTPSGGTGATATALCAATYTCTVTDANGCIATTTVNITQPAVLTCSATSTNVTCFAACNGTATSTVSGGTTPYTYAWTPSGGNSASASSLCPATYTVNITDANGCTASATTTITQPTALSSSTAQTDVTCFGGNNGSATVTVSGGTGAYTYAWTPTGGSAATATGLAAGNYSCTATDANGCTLTTTFNITQPTAVTGSITSTNSTCFGSNDATATVTASGGAGSYTYLWTPSGNTSASVSNLAPATYTCDITDGTGCTGSATVTITEPSPIVITPSQTNVSCFGAMDGTATVSTTGGTGAHSFSWSTGGNGITETGLDANTYTCTVTDVNGCVASQTFQITEPPQLTVTHTSTDVSCFGGSDGTATLTVSGGVPSYSYSWAPGGYTTASVTGLNENMYIIDITDATGCTTADTVTINAPAQILATVTSMNVSCFGASDGIADVTSILGGTGPFLYSWTPTGGSTATEVNLGPGSYTCNITDANGCTGSGSATITEPTPVTTSTSQVDNLCFGGNTGTATVNASGGNGSYSYAWTPSGQTTSTATGLTAGSYTCTTMDVNGCSLTNTFLISEPGMITVFETQFDNTCFGGSNGSATLMVSGGTGTIDYAWSPTGGTAATASGLAAGSYTCTVSDANGCSTTQTVSITEPPAMLDNAVVTDVSCGGGNNGSVVLNMSGGSSPYFYYWSNLTNNSSITGLTAGTYTITIQDANSCTITDSFVIAEPAALSIVTTTTDITCHDSLDGSASVSVSGGTSPYTYAWDNSATTSGISNIGAGNYACVITDAMGCQDSTIAMIFDPGAVNPFPIAVFQPSGCGATNGGFNMSASGGAGPYTYLWSTGATTEDLPGVGAGVYTYTVTDLNGCVGTFSDTLNDPAPPVVTYSESASFICLDDAAITLSAATPSGGTYSGTGVSGTTFDPMTAGVGTQVITYTFTDTLGCTGTAMDSILVDPCTGIVQQSATNGWSVYPNPSTGEFHITGNPNGETRIQCFSAEGRLVLDMKSGLNDIPVSLEGESNGIYLLRITNGVGVTSIRIVKN